MLKYKITAKTETGALVREVVEAENEADVLSILKHRNLFLITCKRDGGGGSMELFSSGGKQSKLTLKQLTIFCRQIHAMLRSGVSLVKAIDLLYQQCYDKKLRISLQKLYESVQKGDLLSQGMSKQNGVYPELMISMVESGEASGTLDKVMGKLASQFESDSKLRNKIISSMTYPAILSILCVGVVVLLVAIVLPSFSGMFEDMDAGGSMPGITKALMTFSDTLVDYWYIFLFSAILIPLGINSYFKTERGRMQWDSFKLKAPLFGTLTKMIVAVRFCRTFATLFASGMAMIPALQIVGNTVGNKVISRELENVRDDVRKGATLSQAVSQVQRFPPMIHSMIAIGEESGSLNTVLDSTAEYFDDEVSNAIQRLLTFVEPALLIIMAAIVAVVILSIMLPMVSMYQAIK